VRLARGELRAMASPDPTALTADTRRPGNLRALIVQPQFVTLMVLALDLVLVAEDLAARAGVYAWVISGRNAARSAPGGAGR
jgi:hypothetical protein